jgi:hypothetical protein
MPPQKKGNPAITDGAICTTRGVPFAPRSGRPSGINAFKEQVRKEEEQAYREHLTGQEAYRRFGDKSGS